MRSLVVDLFNLFKDDRVLCDTEMNLYSLDGSKQRSQSNPDSEFELCSDRFLRLFPTYELDEKCIFRPGPWTETIKFSTLKEIMLSKEDDAYGKLREMTKDGKCTFLDATESLEGNRVAF